MQKFGLALLVVLPLSCLAFSQTVTASAQSSTTTHSGQASPQSQIQTITLGNSAVALTGPWKFQPGDSPVVDGGPLWAQPGFDDSRWAAMDLVPKGGAVDMQTGISGFVPGWTSRGYPKLSGYAWYRLRLRVKDTSQPLWLKMPLAFDDAYQVYANGRYVGEFGRFSPNHVTLYAEEPVSVALPAPGPDGEIDLAVRFYMNPASSFGGPDAGGMHGPPVLGLASTVQLLQASETDTELHAFFGTFLRIFLCLLVAPLAMWAWLVNREERAWLWLFLALAWLVVSSTIVDSSNFTTAIRAKEVYWLQVPELPFWILFWWQWFGLGDRRWIPRAAWLLAAAITLLNFCAQSPDLDFHFIPLAALHGFYAASLWVTVPYVLLLLVILVEGYRRDRTETLWAALPLLLYVYNRFANYLENAFHIRSWFFPFGLGINTGDILYMLMIAVIGVLSLRRLLRNQVRDSLIRESEKKDLEQAQQLQQRVLVPDAFHSPAFSIESEYRPALTVGGDFYQTLSKPDGSLVLVIGDVSGKGISAAMLVAVLIGAIRSQAEHSSDPSEMLAMLNRRMIGRAGGHFATCLAAEISLSGVMRIANAGHVSPYRNGEELDLEGALPLGITDDVDYPTQTFQLSPGDRLTFLTDGVVEATNAAKELYGFDRTRAISNQPAAAIMDQVLTFGQEDDITVLGIHFTAA